MTTLAERIFETVKTLPDQQAAEVLDFAETVKAKQMKEAQLRKDNALATLAKYRGRFKAEKFNRDDCHDR